MAIYGFQHAHLPPGLTRLAARALARGHVLQALWWSITHFCGAAHKACDVAASFLSLLQRAQAPRRCLPSVSAVSQSALPVGSTCDP